MLNLFGNLYSFMNPFTNYYEQAVKGIPLQKNSPIYVYREADTELYQFLTSTQICRACYILGSPQMGKTSLIISTAKRLAEERKICIQIALPKSVQTISEEFLYWGILRIICQQIKFSGKSSENSLKTFWNKNINVSPDIKFKEYLKYLLQIINNYYLIIFIDNVEYLIYSNVHSRFINYLQSLSKSNEESFQRLYFVILGVVKPADLFDGAEGCHNIDTEKVIQLNYLHKSCQPLLVELSKVTSNPSDIIKQIILWTGGQPFLTQTLCSLVVKNNKFRDNLDTAQRIEELINTHIFKEQDQSNPISLHIRKINDYFIRGDPEKSTDIILALNLYKRILRNPQYYKFDRRSNKQMDLLMAGLVVEAESFISVANSIYEQIFSQKWVEETKKKINSTGANMADKLVYNRDVFFLIDRSGSMRLPDASLGNKKRWQFLKESVYGHVDEILEELDETYGKICDEVILYFFNSPERPNKTITLRDAQEVFTAFEENKPTGSTFIAPTLNTAIDKWLLDRNEDRGAFIIIYIDGEMDDKPQFLNVIEETCKKINSQHDIKILMIGVGSDIEKEPVIDFYVGIDVNANKFTSKKGESCNIFVFDLIQHVMNEGIVHALERQLTPTPEKGLAYWIERDYPNIYKRYTQNE